MNSKEEALTVQLVLTKFAAARLDWTTCRDQNLKRTINGQCPLQLATGQFYGYMEVAARRGLTATEIRSIMCWSDFGKWPIPDNVFTDDHQRIDFLMV